MYCSKCGNEIPSNSNFCPECGANCNGGVQAISTNVNSVDINKHKNYLLTALKNPVTVMKNGLDELSSKISLIYAIVITLIIPLIKILSEKISNLDFIPDTNAYFIYLLSYVLFYGIIILTIYFIYRVLLKENINGDNLSNILFVFSVINLLMTIISAIVLPIGVIFCLIINMFSLILSTILIYIGFNNVVESRNKLVYIFSFSYLISFGLTLLILGIRLVSMIGDILFNKSWF